MFGIWYGNSYGRYGVPAGMNTSVHTRGRIPKMMTTLSLGSHTLEQVSSLRLISCHCHLNYVVRKVDPLTMPAWHNNLYFFILRIIESLKHIAIFFLDIDILNCVFKRA